MRIAWIAIALVAVIIAAVYMTKGVGEPLAPAENTSSTAVETGTREISVYFLRSGATSADCTEVAPVKRVVDDTPLTPRLALQALLEGPTPAEKGEGYLTAIPDGVDLHSLIINGNVATADFSDALDRNVGGSCRVISIRSQIEATLKQFPAVQTVVASVNGRSEDALQP